MKVLICVDMQNDFVTGALGSAEAQAIIPRVVEVLDEHKETMTMVLFTQDTHPIGYLDTMEGKKLPIEHCIIGTEGWQIIPEIAEHINIEDYCRWESSEVLGSRILKPTFGSTDLIDILHDLVEVEGETIDEFLVFGLCTDICVISNVLLIKAHFPEIPITVDASCCAGVTPEKHKAALEVMKSCHINVINEEV